MNLKQRPKLLYFTVGSNPTEEDMEKLANYNVRFKPVVRNAAMVTQASSLESAQAVAGAVPPRYAEAYPTAENYDASKEVKLGTITRKADGSTVIRDRSASDGTPIDRTLFTPPKPGMPQFTPPAQASPAWKPNA